MPEELFIALAGNPNAGKTTMFNAMTGARQHVGNYPGITVEKKEGRARAAGAEMHILDLPGAYSLTAYSQEELVARNVLVDERPHAVVGVLNASALERNLYLAVQILELGAPLVLALNMMDEATSQGLAIDSALLSRLLGSPVVETVARHGQGVSEVLAAAAALARERRGAWEPLVISYGPDLDPVLEEMTGRITQADFLTDRYPARWLALKYLEADEEIRVVGRKTGPLARDLEEAASRVAEHLRKTLNTCPEAVIADYRYGFIASLLRQGVLERAGDRERLDFSDNLDKLLTHRVAGPLIMFGVLFAVYQITFTLGQEPLSWVEALFAWLGEAAFAILPEGPLRSLAVSGVIGGVGGVFSFVPLIMIIFFLIAFLEDSGYMARAAYMLDRVLRIFGLHGCSVMPLIVSGGIAGGCAVPGVLASRTLRSPKEKLATLLVAPFMTCGAKLPVFILLIGVFFPAWQAPALFAVTVTAWAAALLVARLLRSTLISGPSTPFVMELPPYRLPTLRGLVIHTWERTWQYMKKAGTVILAISVLLWAAMTYPAPPRSELAPLEARAAALEERMLAAPAGSPDLLDLRAGRAGVEAERAALALRFSLAGRLGLALEGFTSLAGFTWRTNIALLGGVAAKEVIISTLGTAYSLGGAEAGDTAPLHRRLAQDPDWSPLKAAALMLFILLYAPCIVTLTAICSEAGSWKWAAFSLGFNTALAFALAVAVYQGGRLLGLG